MSIDTDAAFKESLLQLIDETRKAIDDILAGKESEGTETQLRILQDRLFEMAEEADSGQSIPKREKMARSYSRMFTDGWDSFDPLARHALRVLSYHLDHEKIYAPLTAEERTSLDKLKKHLEERRSRLVSWFEHPPSPVAPPSGFRPMPHQPDHQSLLRVHDDADERVESTRGKTERIREPNELSTFADQALIVGLTDYYRMRPTGEVVSALRYGLRLKRDAIARGCRLHAWDIHDLFCYAVAVDARPLIADLLALGHQTWDHDRIRPVPWLRTQILILFALVERRRQDASRLVDDLRVALFVDKLPSELEPDLPLMRNWYRLLRALVDLEGDTFNQNLAERMELRAAHFRAGGTIAPIALCDLHGLALCRIARDKGLTVTVQHVYLPLELLEVPAAEAGA